MMAVKTYLAELCYNSLKKYISSAYTSIDKFNIKINWTTGTNLFSFAMELKL